MPANATDTLPTRAYSYLRCSTPEQMQGDTFRRQIALAEAYAAERGWEIDRTLSLRDVGVSAYRGRNATEGMLGAFLEHVKTGEVPEGSVLLVESLDRLSRQDIDDALLLFLNIIHAGVRIVTLLDGTEYSRETVKGPTGSVQLIISLTILSRANEESATKSKRVGAAWENKRQRALEEGEALTARLPHWLQLDPETRQIALVPERAAIVERIFRETLEGRGQHLIAHGLNTEGVKPWGRGAYWQRSYIAKILKSEAVIGTFTPHKVSYESGKRERNPQEPLQGYFPPAISEELWADVQAMSRGKSSRSRGRHAGQPVSHMLARLARCPECGGTMTRVVKGARSRPSLVCIRAKTKNGCVYRSVRVDTLEEAIVARLPERLVDAPAGNRDEKLDDAINDADANLGLLVDELQNLERTIRATKDVEVSTRLTRLLIDLEGQWEEARDTLRGLEAQRIEVSGPTVHSRIERLREALVPEGEDPLDIVTINAAMLTVFKRVTVDYRHGVLEFEWLHGGDVEVPYALPLQ